MIERGMSHSAPIYLVSLRTLLLFSFSFLEQTKRCRVGFPLCAVDGTNDGKYPPDNLSCVTTFDGRPFLGMLVVQYFSMKSLITSITNQVNLFYRQIFTKARKHSILPDLKDDRKSFYNIFYSIF